MELDGFKYINGRVTAIESEVIDTEEARNIMEKKIRDNPELDSEVLIKHLRDSEEEYISERWKNSISNARHFMEQLLADVTKAGANARGESPPGPGRGEARRVRKYLVDVGFFEESECNNLICGVYSYLSEEGSHRGLTEKSCARVSRHIILGLGSYLLEKFESWKKKGYKKL